MQLSNEGESEGFFKRKIVTPFKRVLSSGEASVLCASAHCDVNWLATASVFFRDARELTCNTCVNALLCFVGITPEGLALSLACGISGGVFPVP